MLKDIKAVAFDIDGTLYPSFSLYWRLIPYVFRHIKFYLHYNKVRNVLHRTAPLPDFYEYQGRLLAEEMNCSVRAAKLLVRSIVYDGLKEYFKIIKPFKGVEETFRFLKENGVKIALLSDFPPSQKGDLWGLASYCDLILGTEEIGALKPSKYPFGIMSMALEIPPEQILYVGNSCRYDVFGAGNAGMKTALITGWFKKTFSRQAGKADIVFTDYDHFLKILKK